jgi:uncharacterized membrane protein
MPTATPLPRALLLGAVAGMRSQLPIALLGLESSRGRFDPGRGWLARRLATPGGVAAAVLSAVGELVGDKLPVIPDRTRPGPLAGWVAIGTLVGAAVYQDADRPVTYGAVVGGVQHPRPGSGTRGTGAPDPPAGPGLGSCRGRSRAHAGSARHPGPTGSSTHHGAITWDDAIPAAQFRERPHSLAAP